MVNIVLIRRRYGRVSGTHFSYDKLYSSISRQAAGILFNQGLNSHFWEPHTASYAKIIILYNKGASYQQEDVVWHAWAEICDVYFPKSSATPTGPRWAIDREAYRGYPPLAPSQRKPDLIAIKMTITAMQQAPVPMPQVNSRDFLWIECKAAVHDVPSGWKTVIEEAVTRLSTAHPTRQVFLLIAVGWKWIFLLWDPSRTINQPQLCHTIVLGSLGPSIRGLHLS